MPASSAPLVSSPKNHRILYQNKRGDRIRAISRSGFIISIGVFLATGLAALRDGTFETVVANLPLMWILLAIIAIGALWFARSSWCLGRQYVVHLEIWPRSHLAVARTAGL